MFTSAFAALTVSLDEGIAWALSRVGFAQVLLGAAVLIVAIGIDGFTTKALADAFADAPQSDKAAARIVGHAVELMHTGLFFIWLRCSSEYRSYSSPSLSPKVRNIVAGLAGPVSRLAR
jgi:hypothetical protein